MAGLWGGLGSGRPASPPGAPTHPERSQHPFSSEQCPHVLCHMPVPFCPGLDSARRNEAVWETQVL